MTRRQYVTDRVLQRLADVGVGAFIFVADRKHAAWGKR